MWLLPQRLRRQYFSMLGQRALTSQLPASCMARGYSAHSARRPQRLDAIGDWALPCPIVQLASYATQRLRAPEMASSGACWSPGRVVLRLALLRHSRDKSLLLTGYPTVTYGSAGTILNLQTHTVHKSQKSDRMNSLTLWPVHMGLSRMVSGSVESGGSRIPHLQYSCKGEGEVRDVCMCVCVYV